MTTKSEENHPLKDIMRAKHEAKACGWGCQFCKDEADNRMYEAAKADYSQACERWEKEEEAAEARWKDNALEAAEKPAPLDIVGFADLQSWLDSDYVRGGAALVFLPSTPFIDLDPIERQDLEDAAQLIIDTEETDVTMSQVRGWDDYDLQDWLAAWEED